VSYCCRFVCRPCAKVAGTLPTQLYRQTQASPSSESCFMLWLACVPVVAPCCDTGSKRIGLPDTWERQKLALSWEGSGRAKRAAPVSSSTLLSSPRNQPHLVAQGSWAGLPPDAAIGAAMKLLWMVPYPPPNKCPSKCNQRDVAIILRFA
jgi:hypothetical protein